MHFKFDTAQLGATLTDLEQRRNFAKRVLGFFVMSAWLHALPYIILMIYMREKGILSTEVFGDDDARTSVIGLYMLPGIILAASTVVIPLMVIDRWRLYKIFSGDFGRINALVNIALICAAFTLFVVPGFVLLALLRQNDLLDVILFYIFSLPVAIYVFVSLRMSIAAQVRLYWLPFVVIAISSIFIFLFSDGVSYLVAKELKAFRAGGGDGVKVTYEGHTFSGNLVLLTTQTAYIRVITDERSDEECFIRIPVESALIAHSPVYGIGGDFARTLPYRGQPPKYALDAIAICGSAAKVAREIGAREATIKERARELAEKFGL